MRAGLIPLIPPIILATACGTDSSSMPDPPPPDPVYPTVPAEAQRTGDAAKGYDYLINGAYITCGIPKAAFDLATGSPPPEMRLEGRRGDNAELPYNMSAATSMEGTKIVTANCLQCHAGRINGQLVVGLGAADADFTGDYAGQVKLASLLVSPGDRPAYERFKQRMLAIAPYTRTYTVGVNPADNLTAALMSHRDPKTMAWSATPRIELPPEIVVPVDVPPWWRMAKKSSMFYSSAGRGDHARTMMAASLLCAETATELQAIDDAFVDVRAWITSMPVPKYPFPIDAARAAEGEALFDETCSRCHGTYGASPTYPNVVVPVRDVGTDNALALGASQFSARYVEWFAQSFWGETSRLEPQEGYVPPPLDGIWATAPFFHNGSVPTLEGVLDSTKRPKYWTRSFDSRDYDQRAGGWKFTATGSQAAEPNMQNKVRIYDTTKLGYGNGGHDYGDLLTPDERVAVLEYLKTL